MRADGQSVIASPNIESKNRATENRGVRSFTGAASRSRVRENPGPQHPLTGLEIGEIRCAV